MTTTRFSTANRGTDACGYCGVLSWASRQGATTNRLYCVACDEAFGFENAHQDRLHEPGSETDCPSCNPERETRRLARAADRVAKYQIAHTARVEREAAKRAAKSQAAAAKLVGVKLCADTRNGRPCDGRASKTSDYCSICRPYNQHQFKNGSKSDLAQINYMREMVGKAPISNFCAVCGKEPSDGLHS